MIDRPGGRLALTVVAAALAWSTAGGAAPAATYYVRVTGSDLNIGTGPATAFRTVVKAAATVVAGDTVYVGAGTYSGYAHQHNDGTAALPIRYFADTSGAVTGDAGTVRIRPASTFSGDYGYWLGLTISGDHTIVDGFTFERNNPADTRASYPLAAGYCTNVRFQNCRFQNCTGGCGSLEVTGAVVSNCVFIGCNYPAVTAEISGMTVTACTFQENGLGILGENATLTVTGCTFSRTAATGTHVRLEGSAATLSNCTLTGGGYGVYQSSGASATLSGCTVADAQTVGLWLAGLDTEIGNCTVSGSATGVYLPRPAGYPAEPYVHDSVVRDCGTGIETAWSGLSLRLTTLSGHTDAGLRIAPTVSSFMLGALDTVTIDDCRYGLAWTGDAGLAQALTVDTKTWTGNQDHVYTTNVESVVARNLSLANGHGGVKTFGANQLSVTNCAFADSVPAADWNTEAAIYTQAATVTVADCTIDRWYYGLHLTGAVDPDLQRLTVRDCGRDAIRLQNSSWNWYAADALVLTNNWIGVYAQDCAVTIDGGAPGIFLDGAAGTGYGLYFVRGSATWRNLHVTDSAIGYECDRCRGVVIENCSATGCTSQALSVVRDPADPAALAAAVTNFAATDCANGVTYSRGGGTADGVGQIELRDLTITRPVALDGDGYAVAPTGTGLSLADCPLDDALHTRLIVSGYESGVYVAGADLAVGAATDLSISACGSALLSTGGAVTVANWNGSGNWTALYALPAGRPVTVSDCALSARDYAIYVDDGGDLTVVRCAAVTRDGAAFAGLTTRTAACAFVDCTADAGGDGFLLEVDAAGGSIALERCAVTNAGDDGFRLLAPTVTATDCTVTSAVGDGFLCLDGDGLLSRCIVLDCGGAAAAAAGTAALTADNFLGIGASGLSVDGAAASLLARHVTVVNDAIAARATNGGTLTVVNGVLSGGTTAARADAGGSVILDHVLLDAPIPYDGVTAGSNDLLKPPRFEDAANGDYRPAKGSPMINSGKDLSGVVDDDLRNYARPSFDAYELGAYESEFPDGGVRILKWREVAR